MLFILRQLRRSFFQPGKLRTYVAYAIGEIILIVIGILIAVQIGDWKEARRLDQKRTELIQNLTSDFRTNLENLEETLEMVEANMAQFDAFLSDIYDEEKALTVEEMKEKSAISFLTFVFRPLLGAYNTAISSGSMTLINDPALNELMIDYQERSRRFEFYNEMARSEFFQGGVLDIRKQVGSLAGFQPAGGTPRKELTYSADVYRDFFRQKDVYAVYENFYLMKQQRWTFLKDLKLITEEILVSLEALE